MAAAAAAVAPNYRLAKRTRNLAAAASVPRRATFKPMCLSVELKLPDRLYVGRRVVWQFGKGESKQKLDKQ